MKYLVPWKRRLWIKILHDLEFVTFDYGDSSKALSTMYTLLFVHGMDLQAGAIVAFIDVFR